MNDIAVLERDMLLCEQVDIPVVHRFGPGIYMREITVPAGVCIVGHEHRTDHTCIMLEGRVTLTDELGNVSELVAPVIVTSKPGRKSAMVHEKMVWVNIHATDETDIKKLEDMLVVKSTGWIEHHQHNTAITADRK